MRTGQTYFSEFYNSSEFSLIFFNQLFCVDLRGFRLACIQQVHQILFLS